MINTILLGIIAFLLLVIAAPQLVIISSFVWERCKGVLAVVFVFVVIILITAYPVQSWQVLRVIPGIVVLVALGIAVWFVYDKISSRVRKFMELRRTKSHPRPKVL